MTTLRALFFAAHKIETPGPAERALSVSDRKLLFVNPGRRAQGGDKRKQRDEEEAANQANTHAIFVATT